MVKIGEGGVEFLVDNGLLTRETGSYRSPPSATRAGRLVDSTALADNRFKPRAIILPIKMKILPGFPFREVWAGATPNFPVTSSSSDNHGRRGEEASLCNLGAMICFHH